MLYLPQPAAVWQARELDPIDTEVVVIGVCLDAPQILHKVGLVVRSDAYWEETVVRKRSVNEGKKGSA